MSAKEILEELRAQGDAGYKRTMMRHGAREPVFGVKIEYMKKIVKRVKKDHQLSLDLYATGNSDAMYLAGLIADEVKMTKADLQGWVEAAYYSMLSEFTVPWVASESAHGRALGLKWIESKKETIAAAGWATLASLVAVKEDADLDLAELRKLLKQVETTIHDQPDRVRYTMNGFVIALGAYVKALSREARESAKRIGTVMVDMGDTACKVPDAGEAIKKVEARGSLGKKRKTARC